MDIIVTYIYIIGVKGIRLSGGVTNNEGRVEVLLEERWSPVCGNSWHAMDATVVCRELGYSSAVEATTDSRFGEGSGLLVLISAGCAGKETSINYCTGSISQNRSCEYFAGVVCGNGKISEVYLLSIDLGKIVLVKL